MPPRAAGVRRFAPRKAQILAWLSNMAPQPHFLESQYAAKDITSQVSSVGEAEFLPVTGPSSQRSLKTCIFVCVQPYSNTLFGVPFPLPTPPGAGIGNSGTSPRPGFESCARQPSGQEATSANLFRKECQGCNEARKPSCAAPHIQFSETIVTSQPWFG